MKKILLILVFLVTLSTVVQADYIWVSEGDYVGMRDWVEINWIKGEDMYVDSLFGVFFEEGLP